MLLTLRLPRKSGYRAQTHARATAQAAALPVGKTGCGCPCHNHESRGSDGCGSGKRSLPPRSMRRRSKARVILSVHQPHRQSTGRRKSKARSAPGAPTEKPPRVKPAVPLTAHTLRGSKSEDYAHSAAGSGTPAVSDDERELELEISDGDEHQIPSPPPQHGSSKSGYWDRGEFHYF